MEPNYFTNFSVVLSTPQLEPEAQGLGRLRGRVEGETETHDCRRTIAGQTSKVSPELSYFGNSQASEERKSRGQCYKNTMVNYRSYFNPTFSRVKMMQYITVILG
jgi:hypothetical protein